MTVTVGRVGRMVKERIVEEVHDRLKESPNFLITAINRLPAPESDTLRKQLFASQASLLMVQHRLSRRALSALNLAGLQELLEGSVALILSGGDVLPVAKLLVEFQKSHEDWLTLRGAVIDGQLLDHARVKELASLPPKPQLLAQVVATVESPLADVIMTIERLVGDIAWLAEQAAATKPATSPANQPNAEDQTPEEPKQKEGSS